MNNLAWNNDKGPWFFLLVFGTEVMIDRDSWGRQYFEVRGEIHRFSKD